MKKKLILGLGLVIISVILLSLSVYGMKILNQKGNNNIVSNLNEQTEISQNTISNALFSIVLPDKVSGFYIVEKNNESIEIYDKVSKEAGFGGFAFSITAFKAPGDYASMPRVKKLGELTDKNGVIYDIVLIQPTDVQFDYENKNDKTYSALYNLAESAEKSINGINGSTYYSGRGMKGEELYNDVLKKHFNAIKEKWTPEKLMSEKMSVLYGELAENNKNAADIIGYAFYDTNSDGIEELLIGKIGKNEGESPVYDIYTMVNRTPAHVVSSERNNGYFVCNESFICEEYFLRGGEDVMIVYYLEANSTELFPQIGFKYQERDGNSNSLYISYDPDLKNWENSPAKTYKERRAAFEKYVKLNFIPLSNFR